MNADPRMARRSGKERRKPAGAVALENVASSPLTLKVIEPDRAGALDRLHRGARSLSFDMGGASYAASLLWPAPQAVTDAVSLRLDTEFGELRVVLPQAQCVTQIKRFAPEARFAALEPSLRALLLEAALETEIRGLEAALGSSVEIRFIEDKLPVSHPELAFTIKSADSRFMLCLHDLDTRLLNRLADRFGAAARPAAPVIDLALPIRICLDAVTLGISDLRSLAHGDVVMLDGKDRNFLIVSDRLVAAFAPDGDRLRLLSKPTSLAQSQWDWIMKDTNGSTGAPEDGSLDDVPVTLVFELGRKSMPVSEIRSLAAGSIVEVPGRDRETVSLVANGKRIGEGEIVRIGEGLGVRILSTGANA